MASLEFCLKINWREPSRTSLKYNYCPWTGLRGVTVLGFRYNYCPWAGLREVTVLGFRYNYCPWTGVREVTVLGFRYNYCPWTGLRGAGATMMKTLKNDYICQCTPGFFCKNTVYKNIQAQNS